MPRAVRFAGEVASFRELVAAYQEVTGKTLQVERLGSFDDLDARIDELAAGGFGNFSRFLPLMCYRAELKGDGVLEPLDNDRYLAVQPMCFRDYVKRVGL